MTNATFPIIIQDGKSVITFTSENSATYENGEVCFSSLEDMMVRVGYGTAKIVEQKQIGDLVITHTGLEITSGKFFAYFVGGQFEITKQGQMNIDLALSTGNGYRVSRQWFDMFTGEKYEH